MKTYKLFNEEDGSLELTIYTENGKIIDVKTFKNGEEVKGLRWEIRGHQIGFHYPKGYSVLFGFNLDRIDFSK